MDSTEVEIFSGLADVLLSIPGIDQVTPASDLRNDLGINSLDFIEICDQVETRFGVCITDLSLSSINTFQDAVAHVRSLWDINNHYSMTA